MENEVAYVNYNEPETGNEERETSANGETAYKKAVRWVLLIGVVLMPLFFLPWTTSVLELNKQMLLVGIAGAGLVLWLLDVVMSGKLSWRFNPIDKGMVALAVAIILSTVFSVDKFKSVFGAVGSLSDSLIIATSLIILYFLVVNSFDDNGKKLRIFFSVSVTIAVLYGLLQMLGVFAIRFPFALSRAFNTLGSPNTLGILAAIALPILYSSKVSVFRHLNIAKLGALAALAVLVIINWWVLWAIAIAGMVSIVVFESMNRKALSSQDASADKSGLRMSRFLFPMTVMVLGVFLVVVNLNLSFVKNNLPIEVAPSYELSGRVARETLKENMAFGYGPENFSVAFDKFGAGALSGSTLSGAKFFDATSHVLGVAVNNGIVGLVALGFILWLLARLLIKLMAGNEKRMTGEEIGVVSSTVAGVVAMFLYSFNLTLIFTFYLLLALVVLIARGGKKSTYNVEEKASLSLVSSLGFIGGLILALIGFYFVSLNYVADVKYAKALNQSETEEALNYVVEAINWNGNDDRFYRISSQMALVLLSQELNTQAESGDTQKDARIQNYLSSAVTLAQRATQTAPRESTNWANLGTVYQNLIQLVKDADVLAEEAFIKASELRPGDPSFQNSIGSMYLAKADLLRQLAVQGGTSAQQLNQESGAVLLKAEDAFKKAIELSSSFGIAIYNLGSVYERQGKLNDAIKQLETVAPFNSNEPGLAFELGLLYYRADRKEEALTQLQRAVVLSPDYANARWYLALIYEERKQFDQAIEQLESILGTEANKDNENVVQKLEQLKTGKASIPPGDVLDEKPL